MKTLLCSITILYTCLYFAPLTSAQGFISKLVVKENETFMANHDNILKVDTLVMQDNSVIVFNPNKQGVLEAMVAVVGKNCIVSSKGTDGLNGVFLSAGGDGQNGGNLTLIVNFKSLGKLTVDTRGGNGGQGSRGKDGKPGTPGRTETVTYRDSNGAVHSYQIFHPGEPGTDGIDAFPGGNSGSGGNLSFTYTTDGFIPTFNQELRDTNSIFILNQAGTRGGDGQRGVAHDIRSKSGSVAPLAVKNSRNGQVWLQNLNSTEN